MSFMKENALKKGKHIPNTHLQFSSHRLSRSIWELLHIDVPLFVGLIVVMCMGLLILYSADNRSMVLLGRQVVWMLIALVVMLIFAQIPPRKYYQWAPWLYALGVLLLIAVLAVGHTGKGAQRWLNLGLFRFQPSEILKLAMPMMLAWFLDKKSLPPSFWLVATCAILVAVPFVLTAKQPDLGTALIISMTGISVLFFAGIRFRLIVLVLLVAAVAAPFLWHFLHDYQQQRILIFLNPESDGLNSGYHIIQSKIAIGSGGIFGKGYLNGTQSHLDFLPEHATDFIFAVLGEEFGLFGIVILIIALTYLVMRCFYISTQAQDTFTRLLAGGLTLTFFLSYFVNIGMVMGILPVVGVPLPLISYGGTAMITIMAGFGIIMSVHTHRKLLGK